jgi:hypothetical protein
MVRVRELLQHHFILMHTSGQQQAIKAKQQ